MVDEETQKNDLDIVREVLKVTKEVPIERAYDFQLCKESGQRADPSRLETVETFTVERCEPRHKAESVA
jgi:hypothetical protein